jgi:hypothetical protein
MTGWQVDVPGVDALLGELDVEAGELRTTVADAEDAFTACSAALDGPAATAFASFAADRRQSPREVVTMTDNAVAAAVGAVAALAVGNEEMAEQQRLARVRAAGGWGPPGGGPVMTAW